MPQSETTAKSVQSNLPLDTVIHGDCIDVLQQLPERSIDVVFADPPYNLQLQQALWRPNMTKVDAVDEAWDRFADFAEYDAFTRAWLTGCRRVLKDTGTLWVIGSYHNIFRVGTVVQDLGYWILNDVVWVKTNPMPNFRGTRFTNAHETLIWAQKKQGERYTFHYRAMKSLNEGPQMRSDWHLGLCTGPERIREHGEKAHPTQKPEGLLYRVLLSSTNSGDVVLDPFFGTGTTGAVAKKLHRRFVGIEREHSYVRIAKKRLAGVQNEEFVEEVFDFESERKPARIPFGALLEAGLLLPGAQLTLHNRSDCVATVLANGDIRCGEHIGSIHAVGRAILNAPCNGWERWLFEENGEQMPVDLLRRKIRQQTVENSR